MLSNLFRLCLRTAIFLSACFLPLLWLLTYFGGTTLTPSGWLAAFTTLLPYLYLALFLIYMLLFCLSRNRWLVGLMTGLAFSACLVWGNAFFPRKETAPNHIHPIKVMVWNIQRIGELSDSKETIIQNIACVANAIRRTSPDILVLLEVTFHQLVLLQKRLNIPPGNCIWSDYYGTGRKRFGGLAICVKKGKSPWKIKVQRTLDLPPDWKYLFLEVQSPHHSDWPSMNVLALHIVPPKVTDTRVGNLVTALMDGQMAAGAEALKMLDEYEKQVELQGMQAAQALQRIEKFRDPTIVVGDFNSTRDAALHFNMRKKLIDTWSRAGLGFGATRYWGGFLPLRIDYIYVTPDFSVQDVQTLPFFCSDHFAVVSSIYLHNKGDAAVSGDTGK